jgi:hypothetical protein
MNTVTTYASSRAATAAARLDERKDELASRR